MGSTLIGRQAVVVGAGIAGLTAARVLADHFDRVIVLERDRLPTGIACRKGTPQARHLHLLLMGGQRALCELFPDFARDLAQAGAVLIRNGLDLRWEYPGYDPFPQRNLGLDSYAISRPLIEMLIRRRVAESASVVLRQRCRVEEFVASPDRTSVVAVRARHVDGHSETVPADVVVDASGQGTPTLALLKSAGFPLPEETAIRVELGYSSVVLRVPDDVPRDWKGVMTLPQAPEDRRGGAILPLEGNRWIATLAGRFSEKPPADATSFLDFARQLRTPTIFNAIKHAKLIGRVNRYRFLASTYRHFETLKVFPRGLLPFGDVVCRINPVYGQGMSVAAQQACLLRRLLAAPLVDRDPLAGLSRAFFSEVRSLIDTPWVTAANLDLMYPDAQGVRPRRFQNWIRFQSELIRLAALDPEVHRLMIEVQSLLKPRSAYGDLELMRKLKAVLGKSGMAELNV
jgi:2-polyprenyl-6-methoxyphenol hydroxylase-like FAD-dependent oxidoreductase